MIVGITTSFFDELSPEQMVETFARKGWYNLELSSEHAERLLSRGDPDKVGKEFAKFARDNGVSFPQGHLWLTCDIAASNQDEVIDILKQWLDLFMAIGIRAAVLHPGGDELLQGGSDFDKVLEARLRALYALINHIDGTDITICLENIPKTAPEADDLLAIIKAANTKEHLGICLDTGHLNLTSRRQAEFIRKTAPYLKALHIADNDGTGDQHLMPYEIGTVKWDEVISALKEIKYSGLFNFEIPGEQNCPIPVRLAKLDYLRALSELMMA